MKTRETTLKKYRTSVDSLYLENKLVRLRFHTFSVLLTSAPRSIKYLTMSWKPLAQAQNNGVLPAVSP